MTQKEWMKEGIDLKLMALLYCRHLWISIAGILVGAILSGGLYFLVHVVYAPARQYRAVSKLYLTFATGDDGDAYQYYNGYTWNDLIGTEPIMDEILEVLGEDGTFKEEARKSITADINWSIGYTVFYKAYSTISMVKMTMGKHYCIKRMKIYAELFGVFQTFSCACGIEKYLFSAELNVERKAKIG